MIDKTPKRKATFNLAETTHQGLKLSAAINQREMVDLVEEALGAYFQWSMLTPTELDEIEIYKIAELQGAGRWGYTDHLMSLCKVLGHSAGGEVLAQLLEYLHNKTLFVEVNDGRTGFRNLDLYPDKKQALNSGQSIRVQLSIPGRVRFQQLQARRAWEQQRAKINTSQAES